MNQSAWFQGSPVTVLPMSSVIWLVSVVIGWVRLVGMRGRLPMTIWTASASPAARIMPRMTAVAIPVLPAGSRMWRMVCQRVVPMAIDAPSAGPPGWPGKRRRRRS